MKKRIKVMCVLILVTMFIWIPFAWSDQRPQALWGSGGSPIQKQFSTEFVPGEVLIKFKKGATRTKIRTLHSNLRAREIRRIEPIGVKCIKLPSSISVKEAIEYYKMDPNVKYAEPNYIINFAAMPNDSAFGELWGLHNIGQQVNGVAGTQDADIDAPEAWDITTGSDNIIIAVLDSGVAYLHPEINPNIWVNNVELNGTEGVDDDNNGYIDDVYGWDFWADDNNPEDYNSHGTHVSGTIAARGNNGVTITGVNWNAKIMAIRMGGIVGAVGDATDAIIYAVDNGADIINASWGGPNFSQSLYDAINYANDNDVLFVAAAGNDGGNNDQDPHYPSSYNLPNIIAVAATDQGDNLTGFSNYGLASVDVAAPGDNVYSTIPEFTSGTPVLLYTENFGPPSPSGWLFSGINNTWGFGSGTGDPGDCLEDSPGTNYLNNTLSFAVFNSPIASVKDNYYTLLASVNAELEYGYDYLFPGVMEDTTFIAVDSRTGSTGGAFINDSFDFTFFADLLNSFNFGGALVTDSSITRDGVYIDNLELYREPIIISSYNYEYYPGTSMASPHVAGVAGLVKAQNPNYTIPQIRDAIFNTVDEHDSLFGQVSTEGRVNAFKAVTYIAPPTNFSPSAGDRTVTLNWNANSESAVTGYIISYGETAALGTEIDVGDVTTYEISGLTNGIMYYFRIHAVGDFPVIGLLDGTESPIVQSEPGGDSDGDGVKDNVDNCPNTYNPNQEDSDEDNVGNACDGCPDDPDKTEPGSCGCNNPDTDSDDDGIADCNDGCPNDSNKTDPGYCGCGIPDTDSDGDGILDCEEQGPNGDNPNYDGNGDGTADYQQPNVTSLHTYDNQGYVTLESPAGTTINNCQGCGNPSATDAPSTKKFPYGFFGFTLEGMGVGGAITVTLHLPAGVTSDSYYKYGQTLNNPNATWYEFLHDGQTGAEINGNVITLHFIDGMRGDDDLTANDTITDVGGPAVTIPPNGNGIIPDGVGVGGGGGGCFIATAAYGSLMEPHVKVLRNFRDRFLITNIVGKAIVKLYYKYSPPVADFITKHANLRAMVRLSLLPVVGMSWAAIKLGPLSTMALMVFFGISLIGLVSSRRKKVKK